jgi:endogenous inhibitor of DNA gyrase (YacG/DUF329 family)
MSMDTAATPVKQVRCPQCNQWCAYGPQNRWRPFCSERCRGMDLGAWASDGYRLPQREGDGTAPPETDAT